MAQLPPSIERVHEYLHLYIEGQPCGQVMTRGEWISHIRTLFGIDVIPASKFVASMIDRGELRPKE